MRKALTLALACLTATAGAEEWKKSSAQYGFPHRGFYVEFLHPTPNLCVEVIEFSWPAGVQDQATIFRNSDPGFVNTPFWDCVKMSKGGKE